MEITAKSIAIIGPLLQVSKKDDLWKSNLEQFKFTQTWVVHLNCSYLHYHLQTDRTYV